MIELSLLLPWWLRTCGLMALEPLAPGSPTAENAPGGAANLPSCSTVPSVQSGWGVLNKLRAQILKVHYFEFGKALNLWNRFPNLLIPYGLNSVWYFCAIPCLLLMFSTLAPLSHRLDLSYLSSSALCSPAEAS